MPARIREGDGAGRALLNHNSASDYERDKKKMDFGRKLRTKIRVGKTGKKHSISRKISGELEKIETIISQWNSIRLKDY